MLKTLWSALTPFLWGGVLALVLNIPLRSTEQILAKLPPRPRRALALVAVLVGLASFLALALWMLIPQLLAALSDLMQVLPQLPARAEMLAGQMGAPQNITQALAGKIQRWGGAGNGGLMQLWQSGMAAARAAAGTLGRLFLALVLAIYFLAGKENLMKKARMLGQALLGTPRAEKMFRLLRRAAAVFSGFIAGQCIEACILAGLFVLALLLFRMPYVLPISVVIGITALVPVFGAWLGCAVGALLILPVSLEKAGLFILVFCAVQQFENNVIYPRVVGGRIGLPPIWVLTAVLLGGSLFGAAGLLLGIPAMSVLYHVGGEWVRARLGLDTSLKM